MTTIEPLAESLALEAQIVTGDVDFDGLQRVTLLR